MSMSIPKANICARESPIGSTAGNATAGGPPPGSRSRIPICGSDSTLPSVATRCIGIGCVVIPVTISTNAPTNLPAKRLPRSERGRTAKADRLPVGATLVVARFAHRIRRLRGDHKGRPYNSLPINVVRRSQLPKQRLGAGGFRLAGRVLDVELLHHAVFNQHGIALRAQPQAACRPVHGEIERLGEFAVAVGDKFDLSFGARPFPPSLPAQPLIPGPP